MKLAPPGMLVFILFAELLLSSCSRFGFEVTRRKYRPGLHVSWSGPLRHYASRPEPVRVKDITVVLSGKKEESASSMDKKKVDHNHKMDSSRIVRKDLRSKYGNKENLIWASADNHVTPKMFLDREKRFSQAWLNLAMLTNRDDFTEPSSTEKPKKELPGIQGLGIALLVLLYLGSLIVIVTLAKSIYFPGGIMTGGPASALTAVGTGLFGFLLVTFLLVISILAILRKNKSPVEDLGSR